MRLAFDLSSVYSALRGFREFRSLAGLIARLDAVLSVQRDLEEVLESLRALAEIDHTKGSYRDVIGRELFKSAVITYWRATAEHGNRRAKFGVISGFTAEQLKLHRDYVALRNTVVAHLEAPRGRYGNWITEKVTMSIVDDHVDVVGVYTRWNYNRQSGYELYALAEAGSQRVKAEEKRVRTDLLAEIDRHGGDERLQRLLLENRFDPQAFFGANVAASNYWLRGEHRHEIYTTGDDPPRAPEPAPEKQ